MPKAKQRVAVVDDDPSVLRALRRLIRCAGYDVETFGSGKEFLAALQSAMPDCVIADVQMPGMSGLEVLRQLAAGPKTPLIVMTAHDDPGARQVAKDEGATEFLVKPFKEESLLGAIRAALDRPPMP